MKTQKISFLILSSLIVFVLSSCGGGNKKESASGSDEFAKAEKELNSKVKEVVFDIPSPSEIPGLLMRTGVEYNEDLMHDINKLDKYTVNNEKAALNLGVYAADIGYLISYEKVQNALNYMSEVRALADHLGLAGNFEQALVKRFESNLSNTDSLTIILDQTIKNSSDYLKSDERSKLAALLLTGSLVEGLYISTQLIDSFPKDFLTEDQRNALLSDLIRVILEQEKSVSEVLKLLNTLEKTDYIGSLVEKFEKLNGSFVKLNITEQIEKNMGSLILNDETLKDIIATTKGVREMIVE